MKYMLLTFLICTTITTYGQRSPIASIPFQINENGHMVITVKINGLEVSNFVLDSGASVTAIDDDIASELGLEMEEEKAQIVGTDSVNNEVNKTIPQRISIDQKVKLRGIKLYSTDLSRYGDINGIIGFDLFRKYISEVNFTQKTIRFYTRINSKNTKAYRSIDFVESYCTPEVEISFALANGERFSGKVFFDTGNVKSPLIINSNFQTEKDLQAKIESASSPEGQELSKIGARRSTTVKNLSFGDFTFSLVPVSLSDAKEGVLNWNEYLGLLGLDVIRQFDFILDYKSKQIHYRPNLNYKKTFFAVPEKTDIK